MTAALQPRVENNQTHSDTDRHIGNIKCRPTEAIGNVKIEKVDHVAVTKAIDQITNRTTEYKREPHQK